MALNAKQRGQMASLLAQASREDLNSFVDLFKARQTSLSKEIAQAFVVGQKVKFNSKRGMTVTGTVKKVNTKTIIVDAGPAMQYRVSPSLLTAA